MNTATTDQKIDDRDLRSEWSRRICFSIGEHHRSDYAVHTLEIMITERIKLTIGVIVLSFVDPLKIYLDLQ